MDGKKVALMISSLNGGGAEKVCLTLAQALQQLGVHVDLIILKNKCSYELSDIADDVSVHFIFDNPRIKLYRHESQVHAANAIRKIAKAAGGFDLILANLEDSYPIAERAGLPNTHYVIHNAVEAVLKRTFRLGPIKYWRKLKSYRALNGKNTVAVSQGLADEVRTTKRFKAKSVVAIHNPVPVDEIRTLAAVPFNAPPWPYVIHVGRFAAQKRHDVLFEAFKLLEPDLHLVLLCPHSTKLKRAIARAGLTDRVHVQGFQQNPYPWIKNARALALSSDFEGLAIVLLEALACGTPVASTDCPHGPSEILVGELARFLSPVGNASALADALIGAMQNTSVFLEPDVLSGFSLERCVGQYLALAQ